MQDQGKRLLLAVSVALAFMLIWQNFIAKKDEPPPPTARSGSQVVPTTKPTSQVGIGEAPMATPQPQPQPGEAPGPAKPPAEVPRGPELLITLSHPAFTAQFSSYGGVLKSWHLTDPRYVNDPSTKGELLPSVPDSGAFNGGAFNVSFDRSNVLPLKSEWIGTKVSDRQVTYKLSTAQLDVEKTYTLVPEAYLVTMTVKVTVKGASLPQETLAVTNFGFQDPKAPSEAKRGVQPRIWTSATMRDGSLLATPLQSLLEYPRYEHNVRWTGFEHPYLLVGFATKPDAGIVDKHTYAQPSGLMQTDMLFPPAPLKGGESLVREVVGYLGPKNYDALTNADKPAGFSTGFKEVIDLGWFGFIGKPLLWLLLKFYGLVGNWGIAIIFLTLLVKGATLPFQTKSMRSMKAMAALGPKMKELQAKYKDDRQRQQTETMALYKQYGVNPLSGCLPIFLQMPIWLALYRMLSNAGELYLQPFIPGWINDLTAPDPYYVLPVVLMVTMFAQARLTPQTTDPSQKMQQQFLKYGMPLMFGVMSFFFPSGLTLYIFTNTCISAVHSLYMNKYDKKSLAIAEMIKQNQATAAAKVVSKDVRNAKDANPKAGNSAALSIAENNDADEDSDDDEPSVNVKERTPRVGPARSKRKKGRRR